MLTRVAFGSSPGSRSRTPMTSVGLMSNGAAHGRPASSRVGRRRSIGERLGGPRFSWWLVDSALSHCVLGRFHEHRRSPACDAPRAVLQCEPWEALVNAETAARTSQVTHRICDPHCVRQPVGRTTCESPAFPSDRMSRSPEQQAEGPVALQRRLSDGYALRRLAGSRGLALPAAPRRTRFGEPRRFELPMGPFSRAPSGWLALLGRMRPRRGYRHLAPAPQGRRAYLCSIGGPCFEDGLAGVSLGLGLLVSGPRTGHAGEHVS